jgi:hypothetical protein
MRCEVQLLCYKDSGGVACIVRFSYCVMKIREV